MIRRFDLVSFLCACVVFAAVIGLAGLWLDAEGRARRAPSTQRVQDIESRCTFFEDGSATCPPGVFATTTTVKP